MKGLPNVAMQWKHVQYWEDIVKQLYKYVASNCTKRFKMSKVIGWRDTERF